MPTTRLKVEPLDEKKLRWKITVSVKDNSGVFKTHSAETERDKVKDVIALMVDEASKS